MIAVVGGGITGLALGRELDRLGEDFIVLEARPRAGGVIRSAEVDGRILDWGPQRTRLTAEIAEVVDDLGLADQVVEAPADLELLVYRSGRLHAVPLSPGRFLASDVVSLRAKLRLLLEPLTAGADPEERVSDYFRRKVGGELYDILVAPFYGGLYGSDPTDMQVGLSLARALRRFGIRRSLLAPLLRRGGRIALPPACGFRGGMATLTDAMAATLGDRLRLETPARAVRATRSGWLIELPDGNLEAESVVLTTPARETAVLLEEAEPDLATAFQSLRYNPLGVVHLDAETDLEGMGFQVPFTEQDLVLRGVTFNDSLFGRTNLYTAYLGGAPHPEVLSLNSDRLGALAATEFERCTGYEARVLAVARERMPAWDVTWQAIRGLTLPEGLYVAANWWSRPGLPGRLAEARRVARAVAGRAGPGPAVRKGTEAKHDPVSSGRASQRSNDVPGHLDGTTGGVARPTGSAATVWALLGVSGLFASAVYRLGGRGISTIREGLVAGEWVVLLLLTAAFVYGEGFRALDRRWIPGLLERAGRLRRERGLAVRLLAPLYGLSLIGTSRHRLLRAWAGTAAIVVAVLLVRELPDPWRGIVDFSVAAGLGWGLLAILRRIPSALASEQRHPRSGLSPPLGVSGLTPSGGKSAAPAPGEKSIRPPARPLPSSPSPGIWPAREHKTARTPEDRP